MPVKKQATIKHAPKNRRLEAIMKRYDFKPEDLGSVTASQVQIVLMAEILDKIAALERKLPVRPSMVIK